MSDIYIDELLMIRSDTKREQIAEQLDGHE